MNLSALVYAFGAVVCLASADFFLKLSSTRISNSVGTLVYAIAAVCPAMVWVAWGRLTDAPLQITREGVVSSVLVGISFSLVVAFLSLTYGAGANLSIATPTIRFLGILLVSSLGILVLGEAVTWRYVAGVLLTLAGIYLIITR